MSKKSFTLCLILIFIFTTMFSSGVVFGKEIKIGLSMPNMSHPYRRAIAEGAQKAVEKYDNVTLIITDAQKNSMKQIADVEDLIVQQCDVIVMAPNQADALVPAVEAIKNAGLPLVIFDRSVNSDKYDVFIGGDNIEMGRQAGRYIVDKLNGKGVVVQLEGTPGASATIERKQGFEEIIKQYPDIKLYSYNGDFRRHQALSVMEDVVQSLKIIDAVFAANEEMAFGALQALEGTSYKDNVVVVGMDGLPEGLEGIKNGELDATVKYPTCMPEAIDIAIKLVKGEKVPRKITLPSPVITIENVDEYLN